jgi:hypothetical protein
MQLPHISPPGGTQRPSTQTKPPLGERSAQSASVWHSGTQTPSWQTPCGQSAVLEHGCSVVDDVEALGVVVVDWPVVAVGVVVVVVVLDDGTQWPSTQTKPPPGEPWLQSSSVVQPGSVVVVVVGLPHTQATQAWPPLQSALLSHSPGLTMPSPHTPGTGGANVIVDFFMRIERAAKRPVRVVSPPMIILASGAQT